MKRFALVCSMVIFSFNVIAADEVLSFSPTGIDELKLASDRYILNNIYSDDATVYQSMIITSVELLQKYDQICVIGSVNQPETSMHLFDVVNYFILKNSAYVHNKSAVWVIDKALKERFPCN